MNAKILYCDVESKPLAVWRWGLYDQSPVALNQIISDQGLIGVGYKQGTKPTRYHSVWDEGGEKAMLEHAYELLDWADLVVGWNSTSFDVRFIQAEMARYGLVSPSPFKSLDLMRVCKKVYRFPSFKLDYVAGVLLGEHKMSTGGFDLWVKCMEGDPKARARMARYCRRDVDLLPPLLEVLRPHLPLNLNFALHAGVEDLGCRACGKTDRLQSRGYAVSGNYVFPKYQCQHCKAWTKGRKSIGTTVGRGA